MVFIYILLLELNKYYIGKTNYPDIRLDYHFNLDGSEWTKIYKPIKVYEVISNCDSYDEDKYTLKYMEKEGINNVRGGSFSQIELSDEQIKLINQMIKGATDKCFNCGESGHFIKDCIESKIEDYLTNITNENIQNETIKINSIYEEIIELNSLIKLTDFISIDNLAEIKKESQDFIKLQKLNDESRKIEEEFRNQKLTHGLFNEKLNLIESQKQKLNYINQGNNWIQRIGGHYQLINNNRKNLNKDYVILGLEIIKYNLEKKRRLKEIFKEYNSEDFIKKLLSKLYEKEIKIIEAQISKKL
jgi:predicted GIY-YIG superfamily endonuclease